jgi:hypothetical protein
MQTKCTKIFLLLIAIFLIKIGKPPALPGDSQSLTYSGMGSILIQ